MEVGGLRCTWWLGKATRVQVPPFCCSFSCSGFPSSHLSPHSGKEWPWVSHPHPIKARNKGSGQRSSSAVLKLPGRREIGSRVVSGPITGQLEKNAMELLFRTPDAALKRNTSLVLDRKLRGHEPGAPQVPAQRGCLREKQGPWDSI